MDHKHSLECINRDGSANCEILRAQTAANVERYFNEPRRERKAWAKKSKKTVKKTKKRKAKKVSKPRKAKKKSSSSKKSRKRSKKR